MKLLDWPSHSDLHASTSSLSIKPKSLHFLFPSDEQDSQVPSLPPSKGQNALSSHSKELSQTIK